MKKRIIVFLFCMMVVLNGYAKEEKTPTEQQQTILDNYGEDLHEFEHYSDQYLEVFVEFGDEEQHDLAQEILAYRKKRDELAAKINALNAQKEKIDKNSCCYGPVKNSFETQINALQNQLDALDAEEKEKQEDRKEKSEQRKQAKQSKKEGDPVKITRGSYEQNETDITTGTVFPFNVNRNYDSENTIISSFGYGWTTNLDERIILGTEPGAERIYNQTCEFIEELNRKIKQLEKDIKQKYEITDLQTGRTQIENRVNQIISSYRSFSQEARSSGFSDFASSADSMAEDLIRKRNSLLSNYDSDIKYLKGLKDLCQTKQKENIENKRRMEESFRREERNKKAMFLGMDSSFEATGLETITWIDGSGYPHIMNEVSDGLWKREDDKTISECQQTNNVYKIVFFDGTIKEYDYYGFIVKITDRNGNKIIIERNQEERISIIYDDYGNQLIFIYEGKYICQIINDKDCTEKVSYYYEGNKLKKVTDTDGDTVIIDYDTDGYMTSLTKCDGSTVQFNYGLQTKDGRKLATATVNEEGVSESFEYEEHRTVYTDHDGNKTITYYDEKQRTTKEIKADGSETSYEYDEKDNCVSINENGNIVSYGYDDRGNKKEAFYNDGSKEIWNYDNYNQIRLYTDRDGVRYDYERDSKGNLTEYRIGGKTVYTQTYDSKGRLTGRTVYGQNAITTTYSYDEYGNLESQTCGGVTTEYEYDSRNRVIKVTVTGKLLIEYEYDGRNVIQKDYNGLETTYVTNGRKDMTEVIQKDSITGTLHKTRIEYDRRHLPLKIYNGDGKTEQLVSSYLYTKEGKLKAEIKHGNECWITVYDYKNGTVHEIKQFKAATVPEPVEGPLTESIINQLINQAGDKVYIQKYDQTLLMNNEKLITVTDALGYKTLFNYDRYGNLIKQTDANGETQSMTYKPSGRLNGEQSAYGGWYEYGYTDEKMTSVGERNGTPVKTDYYPDGSTKRTTDRYGITTYYGYDSRGRVSSVQSEAKKVWYEYDSFDRIIKQIVGNTPDEYTSVYYVIYEYSEDGRAVTVTEGGMYKTVSELDAFGNVLKQTDGNGNTKRYEYDTQNQLVASYDGYENKTNYEYNALGKIQSVTQPNGAKTEYFYNYMGLLEKVTDDCGTVYTASYDKAGRLIKERNRADSEKSYEYDDGGRVTKVLCGGEAVESYTYGQNNRTVTVKDGNGENYIYNYDAFGRLVNEKNRIGLEQYYSYDPDGQLETQTNFDGSSTTIVFSKDRTIRTVKYSDGSENRFVYDSIGNITEAENAYGKTIYKYDQGGRMVYQKDVTTGEEIHFTYDNAGNRIKLLSSNRETVYTYGKNNEVKEIFDNKQRISVKLEYNVNGLETVRRFGNGTKEETLYDKAGRVTVKAQKSERGELLWAEGYLYGDDGKRTATVDNKGSVTLYEYNKKGQLSTVYYPYSQGMVDNLKQEAEENGLPVNAEFGENKYLPSGIKDKLVPLMNSMQYGLVYQISNLQIFIKESYTYDKNGNRTTKTTNFGTINYTYDKENRLLSSGSRGQYFINYTYDNMGNLLTEESVLKTTKYAYNSQNRLIYCEVTDKQKKEYAQTNYAYDAFGRRILVQDKGEAALRTLYDGLTFDVIKQSPTFANGLFTDSQETGIRWGATGKPTGERYRYLGEKDTQSKDRYVYLNEDNYKMISSRYQGERTQINVNGTIAAQTSTEGTQYFTTDLLGSVSTISDSSGYQLDSYTYDAFGSLVQGDLTGTTDFGYLGKQNDQASKLYNYGYRDYNSIISRFTTQDPIRDGLNWFVYCNGDSVNFLDLWGLSVVDSQMNTLDEIICDTLYKMGSFGNQLIVKATSWNYEYRDSKNTLSEFKNDKEAYDILKQTIPGGTINGWRYEERDNCHQDGDEFRDLKFCNIDGREIVFDGKSIDEGNPKIVTNPLISGSFNICDPGEKPSNLNGKNNVLGWIEYCAKGVGHGVCDLIPWYVLGNSRAEEISFSATIERVKKSVTKSRISD